MHAYILHFVCTSRLAGFYAADHAEDLVTHPMQTRPAARCQRHGETNHAN
jgi:hypothetical protein